MVNQNKIFSFKIKRQAKNVFPRDVERTVVFLFLLKNIDCGYSLEPPHRGGSNGYPQSMFRANYENYQNFSSESFHFFFFFEKFSIYMNMRVFVMHLILFWTVIGPTGLL